MGSAKCKSQLRRQGRQTYKKCATERAVPCCPANFLLGVSLYHTYENTSAQAFRCKGENMTPQHVDPWHEAKRNSESIPRLPPAPARLRDVLRVSSQPSHSTRQVVREGYRRSLPSRYRVHGNLGKPGLTIPAKAQILEGSACGARIWIRL